MDGTTSPVYILKNPMKNNTYRYFSFILKPLFSFNHHWAMKREKERGQLELDRIRRNQARSEAPLPPTAPFPHGYLYKKHRANWLESLEMV